MKTLTTSLLAIALLLGGHDAVRAQGEPSTPISPSSGGMSEQQHMQQAPTSTQQHMQTGEPSKLQTPTRQPTTTVVHPTQAPTSKQLHMQAQSQTDQALGRIKRDRKALQAAAALARAGDKDGLRALLVANGAPADLVVAAVSYRAAGPTAATTIAQRCGWVDGRLRCELSVSG